LPRLFGKGTVGLLAITTLLPRLFGNGTVGLAAITTLLPRLFGNGTVGLAAITTLLPRLFGNGTVGLELDTIALATHGTVSTADTARTENNFIARASQGFSYSWRIAYVIQTLAEVACRRYNFGGI
jgi:hypothetical protein